MRQHTRTDWPDDWVLSLRRFGRSQGSPWTHTRTFTSLRPRPACLAPKIVCVFFFSWEMNLREFPLLIFFSVGFIFLLLFFFPPRGHAHTHGVSSLRSCAAAPRGLKILITTNYSQTPRTFNGLFLTASSGLGATRFCTCHPPTPSSCIQARALPSKTTVRSGHSRIRKDCSRASERELPILAAVKEGRASAGGGGDEEGGRGAFTALPASAQVSASCRAHPAERTARPPSFPAPRTASSLCASPLRT